MDGIRSTSPSGENAEGAVSIHPKGNGRHSFDSAERSNLGGGVSTGMLYMAILQHEQLLVQESVRDIS